MEKKKRVKNDNLGSLIDLSQIKDGYKIEEMLKDFDKLEKNVKYQINIAFEKKFEDLSKKYKIVQNILQGDLEDLETGYETTLANIINDLAEHEDYAEDTYVKKGTINLDDFDEVLREKIYKLLGEDEGSMFDSNGNIRKIRWSLYFVLFGDNLVYLGDIKNKTMDSSKAVSAENWFGPDYKNSNYTGNNVELWIYDNPAESYLPLHKGGYVRVPIDATYDSNMTYYIKNDGAYILWNNPYTWETEKSQLYYFDSLTYENALIDELERGNYSKTHVLRKIRSGEDVNGNAIYYIDKSTEANRIEPPCGAVQFGAIAGRFKFDNIAMTRYVFKLVKYADE